MVAQSLVLSLLAVLGLSSGHPLAPRNGQLKGVIPNKKKLVFGDDGKFKVSRERSLHRSVSGLT